MFDPIEPQAPSWRRPKTLVFAAVTVMAAYVLYRNERFLIDPAHPVWQHYEPFKWWLLPHGIAGACVLLLAPLQFADHLRRRFLTLHRTTGAIYVASAFVLAPLGAYIQYLDESQGAARSFTIETMIQATLLMTTTGIGLVFALRRMITQHRQWMIRSTDLLGDPLHHRDHRPRPAVRLGQRRSRGVGVHGNVPPSRRAGEPGL